MSRKLKKVVASTLAVAMMAGTVSYLPAIQYSIVQAAETGATVSIDKNLTANAGEEFSFKIKVSNNADGYVALIAWLDIDTRYFELVKWQAGDPSIGEDAWEESTEYNCTSKRIHQKDGEENANIQTIIQLFQEAQNHNFKGDSIFATVTLKVKDTAPSGTYDLKFDAEGDGKLMQGRVGADKEVIKCTPTFVDGAVKVTNTVNPDITKAPESQPPVTQATTKATQATQATTKATQPPVTDGFGLSIKDAPVVAGKTVSTSLNIDANPGIAGFTANLSFDKSALTFESATAASGWKVEVSDDGQKLVVVADPYQDVKTTGTAINLQFKAASTAKGNYPISFSSIEASAKDAKPIAGKGTSGTITVSNENGSTTPEAPKDAIQFTFDDVKVEKGATTVSIPLNIKNNTGLSAFQGEIAIEGLDGFTLNKIIKKDDFDGQWQAAEKSTGIVFCSESGHNIDTKEGVFCKVSLNLPANAKEGTYKVKLINMTGASYVNEEQVEFKSSQMYSGESTLQIGVGGEVTGETTTAKVTNPPASGEATTPKVTTDTPEAPKDAIQFTFDDAVVAEGATTVSIPLNIKNNSGLSAFQGEIQIEGLDGFKLNKIIKKDDFDGQWQAAEKSTGIVFCSESGHNIDTKEGVFCKVSLTLPADAKAGTYKVKLINMTGASYVNEEQVEFKSNQMYSGESTLTIGTPDKTTAKVTDTPQTEESKTTKVTTDTPEAPKDAIQFTFDDAVVAEGATTVSIPLNIKNNTGLSAFQGEIQIEGLDGFKLNKIIKKDDFDGQWQAAEKSTGIVFCSESGHNIDTKEGVFCKVSLTLPADAKAGVYKVKLINMTGASYVNEEQVEFKSNQMYSGESTLTIGTPPVTTTAKVTAETTNPVTKVTTAKTDQTQPDVTKPDTTLPDEGRTNIPGAVDGPTVYIDKNIPAKAGENVTFQIKVTDNNGKGYVALIAWLDINKDYFELVKWKAGDPTLGEDEYEESPEYSGVSKRDHQKDGLTNILTLIQMFQEGSNKNRVGDNVFATVTLKVKDTTPDGVYPLFLDYISDGKKMCAYVDDDAAKSVIPVNPLFKSGSIVVGVPPVTTTTAEAAKTTPVVVTTPPETAKTTASVTTKPEAPKDAISFTFDDATVAEGATTVSIPLNIKNNTGLSAFQGEIQIEGLDGFKLNKIIKKDDFDGQWQAAEKSTGIVFCSESGHNIDTKEGVFCKVSLTLPADAKAGVYKVKLINMTGASYVNEEQVQFTANQLYSGESTLTIGSPVTTTTKAPETSPVVTTTKETAKTTLVVVTTTAEAAKTTPVVVTTAETPKTTPVLTTKPDAPKDAIQFTFDDVKVDEGAKTVSIPLNIKNNSGLSAFQGEIAIEGLKGFTLNKVIKKDDFDGQWQAAEKSTGIVFCSESGHNIDTKEGVFCKVVLNLPADAKAGIYKVKLINMTGASYVNEEQVQFTANQLYSGESTLTIGTPVTTTTEAPKTTPVTTTAEAPKTTTVTTTAETPKTTTVTTTETPKTTAPITTPPTTQNTTTPPVTSVPGDVKGDVNGDGVVNAKDLIALKKYLLLVTGKDTVPNGDINKDGSINAIDMVNLVNILLKD